MTRRWLEVAAAGTLLTALVAGLAVPPDVTQSNVFRLIYVHVPAAWLAYLAFIVTLVGSVGYLASRRLRWDRMAASSAEVGVFFTGLTIVLGMIWGKPVWGVWWTWDARLVTTAVMFFVYLGYLALRRSIDDQGTRARRSAVLGVVAAVQLPIVHFSVEWWRTLHQRATVLTPNLDPQLDPELLAALAMSVVAFTVVYALLMSWRLRLAGLEDELFAAKTRLDAPVAGDAVSRPALATEGSRS